MTKNNIVSLHADTNQAENQPKAILTTSRCILELQADEARKFLLKSESYCNFDLPQYINFSNILLGIDKILDGKELKGFQKRNREPRNIEAINHMIFSNKDGKYAWRQFQLIHPAIYVSLVHKITKVDCWATLKERFKDFSKNPKIECVSLPKESLSEQKDKAEQVSNWWHEVEQKSLELSLDYEYMINTDITDCYGSIYTHSIAWAIHGKSEAKTKRQEKALLGNIIDASIQSMSYGQTNGIPQGSVLMDFIAEIVLGYTDLELSERINSSIKKYHIIRYRDDYRIFVNNPQDGEKILKLLTEVMIELGLKINTSKTNISHKIVTDSFKADKLYWIAQKQRRQSLQQHLLIIHNLAMKFPNSGSLLKSLSSYRDRIEKYESIKESVIPLISIAVDIAYYNPRTYSFVSAILSKLIDFIEGDDQKSALINRVIQKFERIPNTGHLYIWLQRFSLSFNSSIEYDEKLCKIVAGSIEEVIWDTSWIECVKLNRLLESKNIVDKNKIKNMPSVITKEEVDLFQYNNPSL